MQDAKLVVVQSYASRPEADLAKGALEDAGIQGMVQADTAGGMREHLAWCGAGFKILVREEKAAIFECTKEHRLQFLLHAYLVLQRSWKT
jgi:hypothetical protein